LFFFVFGCLRDYFHQSVIQKWGRKLGTSFSSIFFLKDGDDLADPGDEVYYIFLKK
jgi:hypothetical protein